MARSCLFKGCFSQFVGSSCDGSRPKGRVKVTHGFNLVKGKSNHPMEDYHVADTIHRNGHELGLFAIFDGHMGDKVPLYLQKHLFNNILAQEEFWAHPDKAILLAYKKTDREILSHSFELGKGGSTAVTAILIDGKKLWIANVGDSRGVLATGGGFIQLTVDHEPRKERCYIEKRGGFVSNIPGDVPRVNGRLAVSRAFGDKSLKFHISYEPDIRSVDITRDAELLILASDGIWKVIENEEAVGIARKFKDPNAAAKELASEAVKRRCKDDISCVIVRFKV